MSESRIITLAVKVALYAGLSLFVIALFLPSMSGGELLRDEQGSSALPGWVLALSPLMGITPIADHPLRFLYHFSLSLGNVAIVVSPYFVTRVRRRKSLWYPWVLTAVTANSASILVLGGTGGVLIGYFFWMSSFVLVTSVFLVLLIQGKGAVSELLNLSR